MSTLMATIWVSVIISLTIIITTTIVEITDLKRQEMGLLWGKGGVKKWTPTT